MRCWLLPEVLEPIRCQLGVSDCVLDVAMAEPSLQRPRVVPCIGQGIATGVPEHVREAAEGHAGVLADALDQLPEGFGSHGAAALGLEDVRRCLLCYNCQ